MGAIDQRVAVEEEEFFCHAAKVGFYHREHGVSPEDSPESCSNILQKTCSYYGAKRLVLRAKKPQFSGWPRLFQLDYGEQLVFAVALNSNGLCRIKIKQEGVDIQAQMLVDLHF